MPGNSTLDVGGVLSSVPPTQDAIRIIGDDGSELFSIDSRGNISGEVNVQGFNAQGGGVIDDTVAFQRAINAAGNGKVLDIPYKSGGYLITDTLTLGAGSSTSWRGSRLERGANAQPVLPAYSAVKIIFRPVDTTKYLFSRYETSLPSSAIGPFTFENIYFDLGDANGFEFGREDLDGDGVGDPVVGGTDQRYVFGVRFTGCAFASTIPTRTSAASGALTRSGRYMVRITKGFECGFVDCSMVGGDTQIRTWGCDKFFIKGWRSQYSHLPVDLQESGSYAVQHTMDDCQIEGWTFAPVHVKNVQFTCSNSRFEQIPATGVGRFALSATFAVTAASATLTASADMTGILFPGLSVLELTDGTNTDVALVTAVSGTTITVDVNTFAFTWSAAAATAVRIQGTGLLINSLNPVAVSGMHGQGGGHAGVYVLNRGVLSVTGGGQTHGNTGPWPWLIVGNHYDEANYLDSLATFSGVSPSTLPDPGHPAVHITDHPNLHGQAAFNGSIRGNIGDIGAHKAMFDRIWTFSPKTRVPASNNSHLRPFKRVQGEPNTSEMLWAWLLIGAANFHLFDLSLPYETGHNYRCRFRIRGVSAGGTLAATAAGIGSGAALHPAVTFTTSWQTLISDTWTVPDCWGVANSRVAATVTGFSVQPSVDAYLAGILIEEIQA